MLVDNGKANVGAEIRDTTSTVQQIATVVLEATLEVIKVVCMTFKEVEVLHHHQLQDR